MIEIPTNPNATNEVENAVSSVMEMIINGKDKYGEGVKGEGYLDWGAIDSTYKNCDSKTIADKVARMFIDKGYYAYYQLMGFGNKRIPQGTPICVRIYDKPNTRVSSLERIY